MNGISIAGYVNCHPVNRHNIMLSLIHQFSKKKQKKQFFVVLNNIIQYNFDGTLLFIQLPFFFPE